VLQKVGVLACDLVGDRLCDGAVVGGVGEVVGATGRRKVDLEIQVDLEGLRAVPLFREYAVNTQRTQPPQLYSIGAGPVGAGPVDAGPVG
jgi:hypothetical protein